ncbi:hypothetical protein [Sphingomonas sp. OTU376]|uniref:hypothetical protein n=1 Tax=Sphingomonas sp. OTU376 TaxID=3043863 RepID=UPI00313ACC2B
MDEWDFEDRRASAGRLLEELDHLLPDQIRAQELSACSKLPFKVALLAGALAWRVDELGRGALGAYDDQMHVAGILLARATTETVATLRVLHELVTGYQGGDADALDARLMRGIFGSRTRDDRPSARNVLSDVDQVTKSIPEFRALYDELSEYAHPNDSGTTTAFAQIHPTGQAALFTPLGENARRRAWTLIEALVSALMLAVPLYGDIRSQLSAFAAKCEDDVRNS